MKPVPEGALSSHDPRQPAEGICGENMLTTALRYTALGWHVVPLHHVIDDVCSCRKGMDCPSPGKHPRTAHGVKDASADPEQVRKWWQRWPNANIGIACGAASQLIVVDVDPRNGGSLAAIEARYGTLPPTVQSETGGGGLHILFRADSGKSCDPPGVAGVNILADGKMFVAPPSLHHSGRRYCWVEGRGPNDIPITPAPAWLIALCTEPPVSSAPPNSGAGNPASSQEAHDASERVRLATAAMLKCRVRSDEHDGSKRLYAYACRAVEYDLSDAEAIRAVRAAEHGAPFPHEWTDGDIIKRIRDAEQRQARGRMQSRIHVPRRVARRIHRRAAAHG